jgi:galactitol-specific phosphotransferase system IIC component
MQVLQNILNALTNAGATVMMPIIIFRDRLLLQN